MTLHFIENHRQKYVSTAIAKETKINFC